MPKDAQKGKYSVIMTVQGPALSDSRETSFQIQ